MLTQMDIVLPSEQVMEPCKILPGKSLGPLWNRYDIYAIDDHYSGHYISKMLGPEGCQSELNLMISGYILECPSWGEPEALNA